MKTKNEKAEVEIIHFDAYDIITDSDGDEKKNADYYEFIEEETI